MVGFGNIGDNDRGLSFQDFKEGIESGAGNVHDSMDMVTVVKATGGLEDWGSIVRNISGPIFRDGGSSDSRSGGSSDNCSCFSTVEVIGKVLVRMNFSTCPKGPDKGMKLAELDPPPPKTYNMRCFYKVAQVSRCGDLLHCEQGKLIDGFHSSKKNPDPGNTGITDLLEAWNPPGIGNRGPCHNPPKYGRNGLKWCINLEKKEDCSKLLRDPHNFNTIGMRFHTSYTKFMGCCKCRKPPKYPMADIKIMQELTGFEGTLTEPANWWDNCLQILNIWLQNGHMRCLRMKHPKGT